MTDDAVSPSVNNSLNGNQVCVTNEPVEQYLCEGVCDSSVVMDYSLGQLVKKCTCCQPITEQQTITLNCGELS
jgi:hypothetical protein